MSALPVVSDDRLVEERARLGDRVRVPGVDDRLRVLERSFDRLRRRPARDRPCRETGGTDLEHLAQVEQVVDELGRPRGHDGTPRGECDDEALHLEHRDGLAERDTGDREFVGDPHLRQLVALRVLAPDDRFRSRAWIWRGSEGGSVASARLVVVIVAILPKRTGSGGPGPPDHRTPSRHFSIPSLLKSSSFAPMLWAAATPVSHFCARTQSLL